MSPKQAYIKHGIQGLRDALQNGVTVTELIDAPRVHLSCNEGKLRVVKKGHVMNVVDRVLDPRLRIPFSIKESELPEGTVFEASYFDSRKPVLVEYDKTPDRGIMFLRGSAPFSEVKRIAESIGVSKPPLTFNGQLSEQKIGQIVTLFRRAIRSDVSAHDVLDILEAKQQLNNRTDVAFGGLVMSMATSSGAKIDVRFTDPLTETARLDEMSSRESLDIFGIIMADFAEHVEVSVDINEMIAEGSSPAERFLGTVCNLYKDYIGSRHELIEGLHITERGFELDEDLLPGDIVESFSKNNHRKVFQMILNSLHVIRKKPTGTLTESLLASLARIRKAIVLKTNEGSISMPSYEDYLLMK